MARSRWKLCFFETSVWRRISRIYRGRFIRFYKIVFSRKSTIPFCYMYKGVIIHKGSTIRRLIIDPLKIGYKLGEFAFTRKPFHYPTKKTKKKNNLLKRR